MLGDSQLHLHQEDSVGGGGGSGLFLIVTPFISFALSASILRLPEQTETGATRVLAGRGLSNILPQSVLLFLTRLLGGIFLKCARMVASTRDEP